mmetsp:Transcript_57298/g.63997  ORF Transcript_57298/g.63997 Transcript_57298/m.63997 type:complete len:391 (+) Transcript_57298:225-1397(+)
MVTTNRSTGKQKRLTSYFRGGGGEQQSTNASSSSKRQRRSSTFSSSSNFRAQNGGSSFGICPICQSSIIWHNLESHASECNGNDGYSGSNNDSLTTRQTPPMNIDVDRQSNQQSSSISTIPPILTKEKVNNIIPIQIAPIFHFNSSSPSSSSSSSSSRASGVGEILSKKKDGITVKQRHVQLRPNTFEPIPGLYIYEDFITEEEESMILHGIDIVDTLPWKSARFNGKYIGKRWGVHCNLRDRRVDAPENPLPNIIQEIMLPKLERLLPTAVMKGCIPNEANSIDYRRKLGHYLKDHVDDRKLSKESIANVSLAGDCYMTFKNIAKHRNIAVPEQKVLLKRRCLQVITGKSRYDFTHGISNQDLLTDRRVSITMRDSPLTKSKSTTSAKT